MSRDMIGTVEWLLWPCHAASDLCPPLKVGSRAVDDFISVRASVRQDRRRFQRQSPIGDGNEPHAMRLIATARAAKSASQGGGDAAGAGALPSHAEASESAGSERLVGDGAGVRDGDGDGTSKAPADGSDAHDTPCNHR